MKKRISHNPSVFTELIVVVVCKPLGGSTQQFLGVRPEVCLCVSVRMCMSEEEAR